MRRQYLILIIVSLILILSTVLAGISLHPFAQDHNASLDFSKDTRPLVEVTTALPADKVKGQELFTFGEPVDAAIFLEITAPQTEMPAEFALTTAAIEYELAKHHDWPARMVCSDHSNSAPLKDPDAFRDFSKNASQWERLIAWMYLSFDRQYHVSLQNSFAQIEYYTLTVGEPEYLSDNIEPSTITCEERT
jgi:hypothetical protein